MTASGCRRSRLLSYQKMADADNKLTKAAKAVGRAAGKLAQAGVDAPETQPVKENVHQATYVGSGTFIISKPKRKKNKLHQQRARSRKPGMRK